MLKQRNPIRFRYIQDFIFGKNLINKSSPAVKTISKLFTLQAVIGVVGFLNVILIGKYLTPEEYSSFSLMLSAYYIVAMLISPIRSTINKELPIYFERGELGKIKYVYIRVAQYISMILLIAVLIIVFRIHKIQALFRLDDSRLVISITAMVFVNLFLDIFKSMSNAKRDYSQYTRIFYLEALIRLGITIYFTLTIISPYRATLPYLFGSSASLLWVLYINRWLFKESTYYPNKSINYSIFIPVILSTLIGAGLNSGDMLFAKNILIPMDAGYYGAATQLSKMFSILGAAFTVYMFPVTSAAIKKKEPVFKNVMITMLTFLAIAVGGWIVLALFNRSFMLLFFNESYLVAGKLSIILSVGMIMLCINQLLVQLFLALEANRTLLILVFLVIADFMVIYLYGNTHYQIAVIHTVFICIVTMFSIVMMFIFKKFKIIQ